MPEAQLLDPVRILHGADQQVVNDAALISDGQIIAFGSKARERAQELKLTPESAPEKLLAPCLVDPHSVLEDPISSRSETLSSLRNAAAASGFGQLALLPRSSSWRDRPERLQGFANSQSDIKIHLWGGFSRGGEGKELSTHGDLLQHGALGLADDDLILPLTLLQRGLLLGEMGAAPVLLAPRDQGIQGDGMVREGVETLRAGWAPDPLASETLPLGQILELQRQHPDRAIRVMNVSTAVGVNMLTTSPKPPMASVCWWHLVADRTTLQPTELGWRVTPSLGGPEDRQALIQALADGIINAVAVHAIPLDEEDTQQPPDQRQPGLTGHQLVLPSLWQELVVKAGWSVEQLWQVLSFGPSKLLKLPEERLSCGSRRWLLFDPNKEWIQDRLHRNAPKAANQPWQSRQLIGRVVACGLRSQENPHD
ncbi:MAG: Dihydroorotase [Prochlorococcus marinus str. MIT 9215]|jgi:dihydroorotase|nr:MAG: Dihydroorotase [Prochlorococcus marinus str. MIT 9215]